MEGSINGIESRSMRAEGIAKPSKRSTTFVHHPPDEHERGNGWKSRESSPRTCKKPVASTTPFWCAALFLYQSRTWLLTISRTNEKARSTGLLVVGSSINPGKIHLTFSYSHATMEPQRQSSTDGATLFRQAVQGRCRQRPSDSKAVPVNNNSIAYSAARPAKLSRLVFRT